MELLTRAMFQCTHQKLIKQTLHLWSGIRGNDILLGPYFSEGNVDEGNYLQMLMKGTSSKY